jgi:hypothetical protein
LISTGVSSRAVATKEVFVPSGRSTWTVTSWRGVIFPLIPLIFAD